MASRYVPSAGGALCGAADVLSSAHRAAPTPCPHAPATAGGVQTATGAVAALGVLTAALVGVLASAAGEVAAASRMLTRSTYKMRCFFLHNNLFL